MFASLSNACPKINEAKTLMVEFIEESAVLNSSWVQGQKLRGFFPLSEVHLKELMEEKKERLNLR